jgi:hypothetical protein
LQVTLLSGAKDEGVGKRGLGCTLLQTASAANHPASRDLFVQVTEHRSARLIVHLGLEFVLILERDGTLCRRPGADLIDQPLEAREFPQAGIPLAAKTVADLRANATYDIRPQDVGLWGHLKRRE